MSDEEGEAALFVASLSSSQIGELRALDPKALHQRLIVAGVESEGARNRIQSYVYAGAAAPTRLRFQEETALGSHAAMTLLNSAPKRGYAAIAILKCPDGQYVWQRKTRGYPIPPQVGGLCLFGELWRLWEVRNKHARCKAVSFSWRYCIRAAVDNDT